MRHANVGQKVYLEAEGGRAYLCGTVVERPRFAPRDRQGHAWVKFGLEDDAKPSQVNLEHLAPLPVKHFGDHPLAGIYPDPVTGEQRCSTCNWSLWRTSLTERPDRPGATRTPLKPRAL